MQKNTQAQDPVDHTQTQESQTTNQPQETTTDSGNEITINNKQQVNKKKKIIVVNTLVFLIILAGFYYLLTQYFHIGQTNFTESAQVEEFINPVNTRVPGYIKEIKFIEHQQVKKGDVLVVIDPSEIKTQLLTAKAAYQSALAAKEMTLAAITTNTNNIEVYSANIAGAKARLTNIEQNLNRYTELLALEAVTKAQFEQIETEYQGAKAAYDALVKQQSTVAYSIKEIQARLALNEADILKAQAALELAELNLSYTVIKAPSDGIMGRRLISEGQLLNPSALISNIVTHSNKWVSANFLESQLHNVHVGSKVVMHADALKNQEIHGEITAISGATGARYSAMPTDNSTGNFVKVQQRIPVRIEFSTQNDPQVLSQLKAGMNMVVKIVD